ncbi:hypothetical protein B4U80_13546, partial [Leptotrombidium deliense]
MSSKPLDRCTSCDIHLDIKQKTTLRKHPLLKTLICANCYRTYNGGDFSRFIEPIDENGYDNYCRWCADGGTLISCDHSECRYAFCEDCITRNFGEDYFNEISSKRWYCFACNPLETLELVNFAKAAFKEEKRVENVKQNFDETAKQETEEVEERSNYSLDNFELQSKSDEEVEEQSEEEEVNSIKDFVLTSKSDEQEKLNNEQFDKHNLIKINERCSDLHASNEMSTFMQKEDEAKISNENLE